MLLKIALDWTPNTVHTPLLIAQAQGFYAEAGIEVEFISPDTDDYAKTPARKVLDGDADLAICPSESVIAFAESSLERGVDLKLQAVYSLLDKDASSILCSSSSGVRTAKDLDGKVYGSYNARYEDDIIRAMIRNDGGQGNIRIDQDIPKLEIFDAVTQKLGRSKVDATWIFSPWEGVKARSITTSQGVELRLHDYNVPYGYSPIIARSSTYRLSDTDLQKFLKATDKGFIYARDCPTQAVDILQQYCPTQGKEFLSKSLTDIQQYWAEEQFGFMAKDKWDRFLTFLADKGLLKTPLKSEDLFTNL